MSLLFNEPATALGVAKFKFGSGMLLVTLCCAT